jgi:hypothetical protein
MMRNRIILGLLLSSGVLLIILVGLFIFTASKSRLANQPLDTQNPDGRLDSGVAKNPNITEAPQQSGPADPIDIDAEVDAEQKRNYPDVFIYNKIPFENQYFSIIGAIRSEGNPDFSFIVTIKGQDRALAESKFKDWLLELGLTPGQIAGLLIEYR